MKPILEQAQERAAAISTAGGMLTDEQAYKVPAIFMPWSETAKGDRVTFNGYAVPMHAGSRRTSELDTNGGGFLMGTH